MDHIQQSGRGEREREQWHYRILFPGQYCGIPWAGGWGGQKAAAHKTMQGDYGKASIWAALSYPFVSGGTQNCEEQPLLKSVNLYFGEIAEWKLLLVPYACRRVLHLFTSKAKRFAYSDYHWNVTLKIVFILPNTFLCFVTSRILGFAAFH